jgi:hypothetical protein
VCPAGEYVFAEVVVVVGREKYLFGGCVVGGVKGRRGELVEGIMSVEERNETRHAHGAGRVALP